ncbi:glutathione S-transferase C-terminal domain-containing protein [Couchioplanes caeruleus]|uniref:glutathione S-transferase C-terminal domain-containing protein n=1 Tax=Couchioplanes caeruleus TaxID=56438 RepID=UPI0020C0435B|nr:glutathione S-transferase C-terminal domain-containing protein [Couchioplanes caeruleus]UQU62092.1 glutathione S-transferase C-terminal domain-containing protein [Couchioplanes caeruleus]
MTSQPPAARLAGPADTATYGEYRIPDTPGPLLRFTGRITDDGEFTARPQRYHVYGGWFCPWSHRVAITRTLAGLDDVVSMSFVDGERDGRGWAFREQYGPDPVNGVAFLREVYEAGEEGFDGHVSVPALWDRVHSRLVSNDSHTIGIDLATRFRHLATPLVDTYPEHLRDRIEELDRWLGPAVNHGAGAATRPGPARAALLEAFEQLDDRLSRSRYLLGDALTEADIRLWVTLVRYDVGANAARTINPGLHVYPHLWSYARDLYTIPAFRDTTDFATFSRPDATLPDWSAPADR